MCRIACESFVCIITAGGSVSLMKFKLKRAGRLFVLFLVALLPVVGAVFYLVIDQSRRSEKETQEEALALLRSVCTVHKEAMENAGRLLEVLACLPAVRQLDVSNCAPVLEGVFRGNNYLANLGLASASGDLLYSAVAVHEPVNVADRLYFQRAVSTGRLSIGEYALGKVTGKPSLHLGFPVTGENGNVKAVIYAALDLSRLAAVASEFPLPPGTVFTVLDSAGNVLVRFPDGLDWLGKKADLPTSIFFERPEGAALWEERDDKRFFLVSLPLWKEESTQDCSGVVACLSIPAESIYAMAVKTGASSFWALSLSVLLVLTFLMAGGGSLFLVRGAEREATLAEEKYRALFENTGTATVLAGEDGIITLANGEFARLVGCSVEEIIGKKGWQDFFFWDEGSNVAEGGRCSDIPSLAPAPYYLEARVRAGGGRVKDACLTIAPLPGTSQYIISALDITAQKEAERALLRRLDFEKIAAQVSSRFVKETFDEAVEFALEEIGGFARAGRAYLFLLRDGGCIMDNTHEWCAAGVSPQKENLQGLTTAAFPWWMDKLERGEIIHVTDVSQMPAEAGAEKEILESQDIKSLLVLPVFSGKTLAGFIGLDNVEAAGSWREEDILLLNLCAEVIGGALERRRLFERQAALARENEQLYQKAQERLAQLETLRRIDAVILASMDLHLTLEVVLSSVVEQLAASGAAALLFDTRSGRLEPVAAKGTVPLPDEKRGLRWGEGCLTWWPGEDLPVNVFALEEVGCPRAPHLAAAGLAACAGVPLVARGEVKGLLEVFFRSPDVLTAEQRDYLKSLARQAAVAVDNAQLVENLRSSHRELERAYDGTIEALARALDLRDQETEGHSRRVADLAVRVARAMGLPDEMILHLRRGALLHDIGKLGVPDSILHKPGHFTEEEWEIMRRHPVYAWEMLSGIEHLRPALDVPYYHHEKWDGTGYPSGLRGSQIPLLARIFAVVDVWDALLSPRPYRPPWTPEAALAYIKNQAGKHFDPAVVEAFLGLFKASDLES